MIPQHSARQSKTMAQIITGSDQHEIHYDFKMRDKRRGGRPMDIKISENNLKLLKKILDQHSLRFWLVYGTCLGVIRNHGLIPHDTDVDIAVRIEDRDNVCQLGPALNEAGLKIIRSKESTKILTVMKDDEYIDIYFCSKVQKRFKLSYWICEGRRAAGNFNRLDSVNFLGEQFYIPHNAKNYLKREYGSDWRKPKVGFTRGDSAMAKVCHQIRRYLTGK